jgi:2-aminoadipate transaminase
MSFQFATRTKGLRSSAIRDLLKVTEMPNMLSLAGGLPTPDSFPLPDLRREADRLLGEYGPRVVQYSATDGVVELRRWIAEHSSHEFGREVAIDGEIIVTHGSQQALDLLAKILVDPGDVVVSESPAYLGAVQAFELFEPRFEVIPGDEHGMRVELLAERLAAGLRPKLVYVVPNFHNPSGATMSLERRRHLAALADEYELLVVEDDPYGAIRFAGSPLPPVASFTRRVVHLSTFSKIVAPGFRVGWMIGPPEVMAMIARAKQAADLHTATFPQLLLANIVQRDGWLDAQKARIVPMYRDRCNALVDALEAQIGDRISFHRPEGGMFLWTEFDRVPDTTLLLAHAVEAGVAFVPGNAFTIDQATDSKARLSYSTLAPDQLVQAVSRLAAALDRHDAAGA